MAGFPGNISKMLTIAAVGLALAFTVVIFSPFPSACARDDDAPADATLGTSRAAPGRIQTGRDDQGNVVMGTSPTPRDKEQTPAIGPILVVPQVNPSGRPVGPVIPVLPPEARPGQPANQ